MPSIVLSVRQDAQSDNAVVPRQSEKWTPEIVSLWWVLFLAWQQCPGQSQRASFAWIVRDQGHIMMRPAGHLFGGGTLVAGDWTIFWRWRTQSLGSRPRVRRSACKRWH